MTRAKDFSTLHSPLATRHSLLAIDIGNTSTKFGFYENDFLARRFSISTVRRQTPDEISSRIPAQTVHAVVVSSVVPELNDAYLEFSRERYNLEPIFVDASFDFELKIHYSPPDNLGIDRLLVAFAAIEKYAETCVVCDFGTATTIDVVTAKREFLGGIIAPGMNTMSESLFTKTSKLPRIKIEKPASVIGTSTAEAIQAGIYFGYVGLVDGIIERIKGELSEKPKVVATGGFADLIAESAAGIDVVNNDLLLEGLRLIYEKRFK